MMTNNIIEILNLLRDSISDVSRENAKWNDLFFSQFNELINNIEKEKEVYLTKEDYIKLTKRINGNKKNRMFEVNRVWTFIKELRKNQESIILRLIEVEKNMQIDGVIKIVGEDI